MKKQMLFFLLPLPSLLFPLLVKAQLPETDIYLSDIKYNHGNFLFSNPVNITNRKGYDNQPSFTPDGKSLLFVSVIDTTQADVYSYDFYSKKISQVTNTPESEYSPSWSPDKKNISVVRVDKDTGQRFYNIPLNDIKHPRVIRHTDSIGYYCWLNDSMLAMFVLGNAQTLQVLNIYSGEKKLIASDIGRCMKVSYDKTNFYFVIKQNADEWSVFQMDIQSFKLTKVIATLKGNEDFAVMPEGTFLMGNEGKLYSYKPGSDTDWKPIADFSNTLKSFYRISLNAKGEKIAFVVYNGKKP
jgi:Tol biopolymer transport system component